MSEHTPLTDDTALSGTVRVGVSYTVLGYFLPRHHARFARTYPRESVELSIKTHQEYSNPFERGGEIPADYKAYSDWFDKHDKQSYEQVLNSHLTLMGDPERIIEKMRTVVDMGWRNIMLRMSRGGAMDRAKVYESMKLFAEEVIPAATELAAAPA